VNETHHSGKEIPAGLTYSRKIAIDRIVARPIAILLNMLIYPLKFILRRNHADSPEKVRTIVIAKLVGMGSILRAFPMIEALRKRFPDARLILVTTTPLSIITERAPQFQEVLYVRDDSLINLFIDSVLLIIEMWRRRIDLYFNLEIYSEYASILAAASFSRNRYGFYLDSTLFKQGIYTHLVYFNNSRTIDEIYCKLAESAGAITDLAPVMNISFIREDDRFELEKYFLSINFSPDKPYLVINPNATDLRIERRWPLEYFSSLIDALVRGHGCRIFLVGSKTEWQVSEKVLERTSSDTRWYATNISGRISFGATLELIRTTRLMITNDSGLLHIARCLHVPIISLWGPGVPAHYGGQSEKNHRIFYNPDIYCSPCIYKTDVPPCRGNNVCMKSISPSDIYTAICEMNEFAESEEIRNSLHTIYKNFYDPGIDITVRRLSNEHPVMES
jgi:ADP-heptose:LPS heptosyltransferase